MPQLKITLIRSTIGAIPNHRRIVKALGLGKLNSVAIQKDNPAIRGMIQKVRHLVSVDTLTETASSASSTSGPENEG